MTARANDRAPGITARSPASTSKRPSISTASSRCLAFARSVRSRFRARARVSPARALRNAGDGVAALVRHSAARSRQGFGALPGERSEVRDARRGVPADDRIALHDGAARDPVLAKRDRAGHQGRQEGPDRGPRQLAPRVGAGARGASVESAATIARARARARSHLSEGARSVRAAHAPAPQYLDNISNDEITELNIPTACPLVCVAPNPGRVRARNPVSPLTASIRASLADMNSTTPCAPSSRRWASARFQGGTWATRRVQLRALRNAPWQLTRARDAGVGALARAQDAIRAKIEGVKNQTK